VSAHSAREIIPAQRDLGEKFGDFQFRGNSARLESEEVSLIGSKALDEIRRRYRRCRGLFSHWPILCSAFRKAISALRSSSDKFSPKGWPFTA